MDHQNDRQMFSGNWTCAKCGSSITELPFEPRDTSNLLCRECHKEARPPRRQQQERRMFQGNWTCAGCGTSITELPFQPRDESTLKCRDCFKKDRE